MVVGKIGRVTAALGGSTMGEVMVPILGGVEAFYATTEGGKDFAIDARVVIVEYRPPRTVVVDEL
jgi:hypothetical protein